MVIETQGFDPYLGIEPVTSLQVYLAQAMRVRADSQAKEVHMKNCGMGLMTEIGEIIDVHKRHLMYHTEINKAMLVEEVGDLLWYTMLGFDTLGADLIDNPVAYIQGKTSGGLNQSLSKMGHHCGNIFTQAIGRGEEYWDYLDYDLRELLLGTAFYCQEMGIGFFDCARANLVKMKKRYPNGFNVTDALNRNKEHELSHMGNTNG